MRSAPLTRLTARSGKEKNLKEPIAYEVDLEEAQEFLRSYQDTLDAIGGVGSILGEPQQWARLLESGFLGSALRADTSALKQMVVATEIAREQLKQWRAFNDLGEQLLKEQIQRDRALVRAAEAFALPSIPNIEEAVFRDVGLEPHTSHGLNREWLDSLAESSPEQRRIAELEERVAELEAQVMPPTLEEFDESEERPRRLGFDPDRE